MTLINNAHQQTKGLPARLAGGKQMGNVLLTTDIGLNRILFGFKLLTSTYVI